MALPETRTVKVAVIGSGLAGLTSAFLLSTVNSSTSNVKFDVHLFEKVLFVGPVLAILLFTTFIHAFYKSSSIGMDDKSISVSSQTTTGKDHVRIDVPMRSFQGGRSWPSSSSTVMILNSHVFLGYYPNLIALYNFLGVAFRRSDFSYSFSSLTTNGRNAITTRLIYNGQSGLGGVSLPTGSAPPSTPIIRVDSSISFSVARYGLARLLFVTLPTLLMFAFSALRILSNFIRLAVLSIPLFWSRDSVETFRQWSTRMAPTGPLARITRADTSWVAFIHEVVIPLFSAVCTASEEDIYDYPAAEILGIS